MNHDEYERELLRDISGFYHSPESLVRYSYDWGGNQLTGDGCNSPRLWQIDVLRTISEHLKNKTTRYSPLKIAISSGHGIGKTALISWILHWAMSTCSGCKCVVTANTGTQLDTKTWPEVQKWFGLAINSHWFDIAATSISIREKRHSKLWRIDAIPWNEQRPESFAGLHNQGKRIVVVYDEASSIPDKIWEVTEGALTDENTEIIWIAFGNPTRNTGKFSECFGRLKNRWITKQIDSRTVAGTNKIQLQEWVDDYGEDSDFVRVRVRGIFPRSGTCQFIGSDVVELCRAYQAENITSESKTMAIDVARFGNDQTVFCIRQGCKVYPLFKYRGLDNVEVAQHAAKVFRELSGITAINVDGGGTGSGVVDTLRRLVPAYIVNDVNFGASATESSIYFNKRAEMWGTMREALKAGIEIPDDRELITDLTAVEYGFSNKNQIQLEKKEDMKRRGLSSPDCGDALALTYAQPEKRVFTAITTKNFKSFAIDWKYVRKNGVLYGSYYQDAGGNVSFVTAVYDEIEDMLLVRSAEVYDCFDVSVVARKTVEAMRLMARYETRRFVCNREFYGNDPIKRSGAVILSEELMRLSYHISAFEPIVYDERGAIIIGNKMLKKKNLLVHKSLELLVNEMSTWEYDNNNLQPGHLCSRALLYILCDIRASIISASLPPQPQDYSHVIGEKKVGALEERWMVA